MQDKSQPQRIIVLRHNYNYESQYRSLKICVGKLILKLNMLKKIQKLLPCVLNIGSVINVHFSITSQHLD